MRGTEVSEFIDSAYTWQERATKAEAEVERLQKVYSITNESWQKIQAENAKLRKVADAARKMVKSNRGGYVPGPLFGKLQQALAELDKEES